LGVSELTVLAAEDIQRLLEAHLPRADLRGETIQEVGSDFLRMRLPVTRHHISPDIPPGSGQAVLSAPLMMGLADTAMYACIHAAYGANAFGAIVSLNISFLQVAGNVDLEATARLIRKGRKLAYLETYLRSVGATDPAAHVTATYSIWQTKPVVQA